MANRFLPHKGKRCRCGGGWEAWVYLPRERRKVRKTFDRESEARSWRAEAQAAATKGGLRPVRYDKRPLSEAIGDFVVGMEAGKVRPRGREGALQAKHRALLRARDPAPSA